MIIKKTFPYLIVLLLCKFVLQKKMQREVFKLQKINYIFVFRISFVRQTDLNGFKHICGKF